MLISALENREGHQIFFYFLSNIGLLWDQIGVIALCSSFRGHPVIWMAENSDFLTLVIVCNQLSDQTRSVVIDREKIQSPNTNLHDIWTTSAGCSFKVSKYMFPLSDAFWNSAIESGIWRMFSFKTSMKSMLEFWIKIIFKDCIGKAFISKSREIAFHENIFF